MLKLGERSFDLVRAPSGFFVDLDLAPGATCPQVWNLEAYFVPGIDTPPRADYEQEYLRLTVRTENYCVSDWRNLHGLGLDPDDETCETVWFGSASLENLLVGDFEPECVSIAAGDMVTSRTERYHFHCEFDGELRHKDGRVENVEFIGELPFAGVSMKVPVNAANPVAYAHARASRVIGPLEIADGRVQAHDWRAKKRPGASLDNTQLVTLSTAWRKTLA